MAAPTAAPTNAVGTALVDFSLHGLFPEDDVSSTALTAETLPAAIQTLSTAKTQLEDDIHAIVADTADDVRTWITNAKALQVDIARRKVLAGAILARADVPQTDSQAIAAAEAKARLLTDELNYNLQVRYLLEAIRNVNGLLDQVEQAAGERRILDALHLLEKSWTALDAMPVSKSCRAMRLLDLRAFELKSAVHQVFDHVWGALVHVDAEQGTLAVLETRTDEPMSLSNAVIGLKAYKEVDGRMTALWHELDKAIVGPRTSLDASSRPGIFVDQNVLGIRGEAGDGIEALFADVDRIFSFLAARLPADLMQSISVVMIPELVTRIVDGWLASAVPTTLDQMAAFDDTIHAAGAFCARLTALQYTGFGRLQEWVEHAPMVWLSKRRETTLDAVRQNVALGLGTPKAVERVEKHMVSRSEGKELAANGPAAATEQAADWDAAWSEEETEEADQPAAGGDIADEDVDAWAAWGDEEAEPKDTEDAAKEETAAHTQAEAEAEPAPRHTDEDDAADAWGWGDDGDEPEKPATEASPSKPSKTQAAATQATTTRELVLRETYHISALPGPLLALITALLADGAVLLSPAYADSAVAGAAAGLFRLPALALAMFRAVSPHAYALDAGGSMFLYNDATYLAEQLAALATAWPTRADVGAHARALLRLDGEVATLQTLANRAYGRELALQKTVLRDLMGGGVAGGGGGGSHDDDDDDAAADHIDAAVARVQSMAVAWEGVLAPSAWCQAVGALVEAVAAQLVGDVLEMPSIGQEEAFRLAGLMARVTELDGLFTAVEGDTDMDTTTPTPTTAQYVPSWLRMQYLCEVLQSNLREVRYLWMESELSLYFSAAEVVDLIRLSFEDNSKAREVAREIAQHPHPVEV